MRWALALLMVLVLAGCGSANQPPSIVQRGVDVSTGHRFGAIGSPTVGQLLGAIPGQWGNGSTTFTYQWKDCDSSGNSCVNAGSPSTNQTYTVVSGDNGSTIRVAVTGNNGGTHTSPQTGVVGGSGGPSNTGLPVVSGYTTPGSEVSTTTGTWTGSPTSYAYQWQDCNASGGSCVNATGATSGSCSPTAFCYVATSAEATAGNTLKAVVTATNGSGSNSTGSAVTIAAATTQLVGAQTGSACALTDAAGDHTADNGASTCWGLNTGVTGATGCTEAQIVAGSPTQCGSSYFTHTTGDQTITTAGTIIDHKWIAGCLAIEANNVTIRDSLIIPNGDTCTGGISGSGGSQSSAINDGQTNPPTGTLIQDTTVDGTVGSTPGSCCYGLSIDQGTVSRTNSFQFVDPFYSDGQNLSGTTTQLVWTGDYSHDMMGSLAGGGHEQNFTFFGATYLTLENSYAITNQGDGAITGALNWQPGGNGSGDYSTQAPAGNVTVDGSYLNGMGGVDMIDSCGVGGNEKVTNNVMNGSLGVSYWRTTGTGLHGTAGAGNVWSGNLQEAGGSYADPGAPNC